MDLSLYKGREQTFVKHFILRQYLEKFAHIIGWSWPSITYVDCFSGPWESHAPDLSDTSFAIAVDCFRKARADLASHGKHPEIRCLFLEKSRKKFRELQAYTNSISDIDARALNGELETSVDDIVKFVRAPKTGTFTFLFIDPTGWTGFALDVIEPLLRLTPGETLINFMTHHIRRFVDLDEAEESFLQLFGSDVRDLIQDLPAQEREEKLVGEYMRRVKKRGGFEFINSTVVFKPDVETTHFHLIYATRHERGVDAFKKVEEQTMPVAVAARAEAKERRRLQHEGESLLLWSPADHHRSSYLEDLRNRYLTMAKEKARKILVRDREVRYGRLWRIAVAFPFVWEKDLRDWLREWRNTGQVEIRGLTPRQQPNRTRDELVVWLR